MVAALAQIPLEGLGCPGILPSDGFNQSTSSVEGTDSGASPCTENSSAELHGHQLRSTAGANPGREERLGGNPSLMDIRPKALMVVYYLQDCEICPGVRLHILTMHVCMSVQYRVLSTEYPGLWK